MNKLIVIFFFACTLIFSCTEEKKTNVIGLQSLNFFPNFYVDSISSAIERFYGFKTVALKNKIIPNNFFSTTKSARYRADSIVDLLNREMPDDVYQIIGLTCVDISTTKKDKNGKTEEPVSFYENWAVCGLANHSKPGSVVSTFRVQGPNQKLVIERIQKISLHELGHNIGLRHCENINCCMHPKVESFKAVDSIALNLCIKCKTAAHQLSPKN